MTGTAGSVVKKIGYERARLYIKLRPLGEKCFSWMLPTGTLDNAVCSIHALNGSRLR